MKYVVLGSAGQLGRDLCPRLEGEVAALTRAEADLGNPEQMRATLTTLRPDVVFNCAAYNFVDQAEKEPNAAFAVNAWGVRALATACRDLGCLLVHFSTDYVFGLDEQSRQPLTESDTPGPVSVYGLSKLSGEYLVRTYCPRHFVIRTCGLYGVWGSGGKGGNFVETMLKVASEGKPLRVVADQFCTPSSTADVAMAAIALARNEHYGLYHVVNGGSCSWYEFAQGIFELRNLTVDLAPTTSAAYARPARRPAYSVLSTEKYAALGLPSIPPWRDGLKRYLQERERKGSSS